MDEFKILHSENWNKASWQEKLEALQKLENLQAAQHGRKPYVIELEQYKNNRANGACHNGKGIIYLNENLLKNNENFSNYRSIESVFHEGRHSYQYMVYERKIEHSNEKEVADWIKNKIFYVNGSENKLLYELQPREMDARKYGLAELEKFYNGLEKSFGKDENITNYFNKRKDEEQEIIKDAIKKYGQDYLLGIEKHIDKLHYESRLDRAEKAYEEKYLKPLKEDLVKELEKIYEQKQSIYAEIQQKNLDQKEIELVREQLDELKTQEIQAQNELFQLSQTLHSPEAQKEIEKNAQELLEQDQKLYMQKLETKVEITNDTKTDEKIIENLTQEFTQQEEVETRQLTVEESKELANEIYYEISNDKEVSKLQEQFIKIKTETKRDQKKLVPEKFTPEQLEKRLEELENKIRKFDFERADLSKKIYTEKQVEAVARGMFTGGETTKLNSECATLKKEQQSLEEAIKKHQENKPKMLDFEAKKVYEQESKHLESLKKDLEQRYKKNIDKIEKMKEQLQKPESKQKIEQIKESILQRNFVNQEKVNQLAQKIGKLRTERAEVSKCQFNQQIERSKQLDNQINKSLEH